MTNATSGDTRRQPSRRLSDLLYSEGFRAFAYQLALAAAVVFLGYYLYQNVVTNLRIQNIATGFGFLHQVSQFEIGESLISYSPRDTYGRALLVGFLNTLTVSAAGIGVATVIGFLVGIGRVSGNWLIVRIATTYVEIFRNIPVILQVIFWSAVIRNLPSPRDAIELWGVGFLTNRGLTVAVPVTDPAHTWMGLGLLAGVALAILSGQWARRHRELTGRHVEMLWPWLAMIVGIPALIWLGFGAPSAFSVPAHKGFNFVGGANISPEFTALLMGISTYSSAFIAEIVRAGIQATPRGQIEAAKSIVLRPRFIMRHVVLPQALRVIVPPLTSQYVSLIKNSSIAVIVGYPDLVNIGNTMMNQTGQAVEAIAVMMVVYLAISLFTSALMNIYNRLVAIKER